MFNHRRLLISLLPLFGVSLALGIAGIRANTWKPHYITTCRHEDCAISMSSDGDWRVRDGGKTVRSGQFGAGPVMNPLFIPTKKQRRHLAKLTGGKPLAWSRDGKLALVAMRLQYPDPFYGLYTGDGKLKTRFANISPDFVKPTHGAFSPDDSIVVFGGPVFMDAATGAKLWTSPDLNFQFTNDGQRVVTLGYTDSGKYRRYRTYEARTGRLLNEALAGRPQGGMLYDFTLSPDGRYLLAGDCSNGIWMLRVW